MKSLKQICESSLTQSLYEVSILADIDDQIEAYDNSIRDRIEKWIKENYDCTGLKISDKPNEDGLYEVAAKEVYTKNRNITSLTNRMFVWDEVRDFNCMFNKLLTSLEGAPKEVGRSFNCSDCTKLESLKGNPQKIGKDFNCSGCILLTTLEGAPKEVGGDFYCLHCDSLKSLKGSPKNVGADFACSFCDLLTSLAGAPKEIGGDFYCHECKKQFTIEDIRKVSNVKGRISVKI